MGIELSELKEVVIVFTKFPEKGKVKTRLAETIGNENAVEIYTRLLKHTEKQLVLSGKEYVVYWGNYIPSDMVYFSSAKAHYLQCNGDLGAKMKMAFSDQFSLGFNAVLGVGCDCYQLQASHFTHAFVILESNKVVYGPADDGGYYLIGMSEMQNMLFDNLPWSTETLLDVCKERLIENKVTYSVIEKLSDVDYFEDLPKHWKDEFRIQ